DGLVRGRVQARRRAGDAVSDLRQHVYLGGRDCAHRVWDTDQARQRWRNGAPGRRHVSDGAMMASAYDVSDRRPIAARRLAVMNRLAAALARAGVSPNAISIAGLVCGVLAGLSLWRTASSEPVMTLVFWLAAAALIQLR